MLLEDVKTVEVERGLRATALADGTKAKVKCVMSALFSHAVRWEFCDHNPISSGIPVGTGGKRRPSIGVRISAKRPDRRVVSASLTSVRSSGRPHLVGLSDLTS